MNSHGAGDDVWLQTAVVKRTPIVIEQLITPVIHTDSGTARSRHERKSLQLWLVRHGETEWVPTTEVYVTFSSSLDQKSSNVKHNKNNQNDDTEEVR